MLVPAILYKEEIHNLFYAYYYSDDMMLYSGWLGSELPSIGNESDGNNYQFAIIDDDNKLIGMLQVLLGLVYSHFIEIIK